MKTLFLAQTDLVFRCAFFNRVPKIIGLSFFSIFAQREDFFVVYINGRALLNKGVSL